MDSETALASKWKRRWKVEISKDYKICILDAECLVEIATVDGWCPDALGVANLIAAAPLMLDALLAAEVAVGGIPRHWPRQKKETLALIRAALEAVRTDNVRGSDADEK